MNWHGGDLRHCNKMFDLYDVWKTFKFYTKVVSCKGEKVCFLSYNFKT
jgi:hypothetical protein